MKPIVIVAALLLGAPLAANAMERCEVRHMPAGKRQIGTWISADNWLAPGSLRSTLSAPEVFMPATRFEVERSNERSRAPGPPLDIERLTVSDPVDGTRRDLGFLLAARLNADALVVLKNGQRIGERYWHGTPAEAPRLLLSGTRPVLSLLAATAMTQGKLAGDKAITRQIPALADHLVLRKLSVRRLLEGDDAYGWAAADLDAWQTAGGWRTAKGGDVRGWLLQHDAWSGLAPVRGLPPASGRPEDELIAWLIAESTGKSPGRLFCETLLAAMKPEHPALWLTDPAGNDLAAGLALTPRDQARLGQLLLDARASGKRSRLPDWLIEALAAPAGSAAQPELAGLPGGSEMRYGFVRIGGRGSRIALIGPYGNSLYVDFDRQLVIALAASHPESGSPLLLASLQEAWRAITAALPAERR